MSHFYGWLRGSRGEDTRCGTEKSGMEAEAQGWRLGGVAVMSREDGLDYLTIYRTRGQASRAREFVARFRCNLDGTIEQVEG